MVLDGGGERQRVFPQDFLLHEQFDNKIDSPESLIDYNASNLS